MVRKVIRRCVTKLPDCNEFVPLGQKPQGEVVLGVDEYETIRLIDYMNFTQLEASQQLGVGRTTVQAIYDSARKKIAKAMVDNLKLKIDGGEYYLSENEHIEFINDIYLKCKKENRNMKVAITYENGNVFPHFGRSENFKVYEIEDKKVLSSEVINTEGQGHGQLALMLKTLKVDVIICGGIGPGAINLLGQYGIQVIPGQGGNCDEVINGFLNETLVPGESTCNHDHEHHDHECNCGGEGHHHDHNHECNCGGEGHHNHECGCHHDK